MHEANLFGGTKKLSKKGWKDAIGKAYIPESMGLRHWKRKGDDLSRAELVPLLCLKKSGRYDLWSNPGGTFANT